ncbi:MAG: dephospho-CoA kinase [Chitinophagales bacterium]|jgi:dephospho-CoA kinase|nr:dephospho-CoA kinase [Chitinophagales bacterium]
MLKVGLTGGIGSGKSTVAKIFQTLGIPVFDADAVAKSIMHTNTSVKAGVIEAFGEAAYRDGELNRKFIADIVFKDPFQLEILNSIVHPATMQAAEEWFQQQEAPYVIKEAALLFEAGSAAGLDLIIGVTAPQHVRIHRVMQRDGVGRQEVLTRMGRQIEDTIKMRLCDVVIKNDGVQALLPQVLALHEDLLKHSRQ